ncbi:MAG: 2-amino-4-hydroxy-6-hydroxymethyldihydropteridine diphosphokinase [Pseudomonadota bacterium]|nr:2-amino-4-hydroxy-6-hydroxymethyldihydropteridine diphosphokinase [Pseudomonadota bacterium]
MTRAWVSVGSNIDREANILAALTAMERRFGTLKVSRVYRTAPVGFEGEDFYNLVAGFETGESPLEVARVLRKIEDARGRERGGRKFSPRTLDLDLLLYGDLVVDLDGISLPRDEILRYAFVLGPLAEIAAATIHPVEGRRIGDLWAEFEIGEGQLTPVSLSWVPDRT